MLVSRKKINPSYKTSWKAKEKKKGQESTKGKKQEDVKFKIYYDLQCILSMFYNAKLKAKFL